MKTPATPPPGGTGKGKPGQSNPIVDKTTALTQINSSRKSSQARIVQLNAVIDIILEFEVDSKIKVVLTPKERERSERTGIIQGFRYDRKRGWQLIFDNNGIQEHVTIDGKGYPASILELRLTDKGIELLDKNDGRAVVSIERV